MTKPKTKQGRWGGVLVVVLLSAVVSVAWAQERARQKNAKSGAGSQAERVKRGEYLTTVAGCNDCHTPLKMGKNGPEPDMTRKLSGHPESLKMTTPPQLSPPWMMTVSVTSTAFAGPWGTSFSANLTPDRETGVGNWTEQTFITAMREGKHEGRGRQILPPMPWQMIGQMTDEDLSSIFAYLQTLPPTRNRVPDPLPPPAVGGSGAEGSEGAPQPESPGR